LEREKIALVPPSRIPLVKDGFERWNRGDPSWVLEHMSPEVEWITPPTDPYPGVYRGHAGVQEFWSRWAAAVGHLRFTPQEMHEAEEHVVVVALRSAKSQETGLEVLDQIAQVFTFDADDKCVRVQEFHGREAAFESAGLKPS
jgi:ketosteroid isomerase-like protein